MTWWWFCTPLQRFNILTAKRYVSGGMLEDYKADTNQEIREVLAGSNLQGLCFLRSLIQFSPGFLASRFDRYSICRK
jgi:hypothetical protein